MYYKETGVSHETEGQGCEYTAAVGNQRTRGMNAGDVHSLHSFSLEGENSGSGMQAGHSFVRDNPKCSADLFTKLPPELPTHITCSVTMGPMCLKPRLIPPYQ